MTRPLVYMWWSWQCSTSVRTNIWWNSSDHYRSISELGWYQSCPLRSIQYQVCWSCWRLGLILVAGLLRAILTVL